MPTRKTIILKVKRLIYLVLLLLVPLLASCTVQEPVEPAEDIIMPPVEATDSPPSETAVPLPTDTAVPPIQFPTATPTFETIGETAQQPPTAEPVNEPVPTTVIESAVEDPGLSQVISGQTAEGAFFYGNPDAPVTLFDYSDFL